MPADLCVSEGFPGLLPQVLVRDRQGIENGEPGCLFPAPRERCNQAPEREPPEVLDFFPFPAGGSAGAEETGETPKDSHRAA